MSKCMFFVMYGGFLGFFLFLAVSQNVYNIHQFQITKIGYCRALTRLQILMDLKRRVKFLAKRNEVRGHDWNKMNVRFAY